jgi:hypothetical protein
MKKLIFVLMFNTFLYNFIGAQCGFESITVDSCCVTVTVKENEHPRWILDFDKDTSFLSTWLSSNTVSYCFDTVGVYDITVTYYNSSGNPVCGATQAVMVDTMCNFPCVQWICWDMLAHCCILDTITGFEIIVNGSSIVIPLTHTYVAGAYQWLADTLVTIMESYSYGGEFYSYHETEECKKGNDVIPGFFFVNSSIQIVGIIGLVDCNFPGTPPDWKETKVGFNSINVIFSLKTV